MLNRRGVVVVTVAVALIVVGGAALALRARRNHPSPAATRTRTSTTPYAPPTTSVPASTSTEPASTTITSAPSTTVPPTSVAATIAPTTTPTPVTARATTSAGANGASLAAVRGQTIAVDPGHNGGNYAHGTEISRPVFIGTQTRACDTTGTQTDSGYTEAAYNLDVSLRLRDVLQAAGAHVVMSRTTNDGWGPCIDERAGFGNRAHAAVAISIHADGGPATGRGFHVNMPADIPGYTDDIYAASHRLGLDVRDAFAATGMPTSDYFASQGLIERSDLGGLNLSNVPKVMVETGNMRNATDAALLASASFRESEAHALAVGLAHFLAGS